MTKLKKNENEKYVKQVADITDEEGLKLAGETKDGLCQHYNKLFIAGTKDWPGDAIDDSKLSFDDTLNKTKRGSDADTMKLIQLLGTASVELLLFLYKSNITNKVITHMG